MGLSAFPDFSQPGVPDEESQNEPTANASSSRSYLPHLDGLRAVALAGVLLFHFDPDFCRSGFLGVDVFLVLSGFLITRNILHSLAHGTFTFRNFYVSRFWRLYPASLLTSFFTLLAAFLVFPAELALETARSALSSMFLTSNFYFWSQVDYFDSSASVKPLLHTWSLSLEEQFYLFWPLILYCANRLSSSSPHLSKLAAWLLPFSVAFVAVASIILNLYIQQPYPAATFFLLPPRIYEFGIGAITALLEPTWQNLNQSPILLRAVVKITSLAALPIISASFFVFSANPTALQVCPIILATALQIATPNSFTNHYVLSAIPMRKIGHVTYSAYLVHWPLYVFGIHVADGLGFPHPNVVALCVTTFALAYVMRLTVEEPLRKKRSIYFSRLFAAIGVTLVFALLGSMDGWMFRYRAPIRTKGGTMQMYRDLCLDEIDKLKDGKPNLFQADSCWAGDLSGKKTNIVVIGDSFARHLLGAFDKLGKQRGEAYRFSFNVGCAWFPKGEPVKKPRCETGNTRRWKMLANVKQNMTVIVANLWGFRTHEQHTNRVVSMDRQLRRLGHTPIISGEPPGLGVEEKPRFACLELQLLPFGKLIDFLTGFDPKCIRRGPVLAPRYRHADQAVSYNAIFNASLPKKRFFNLFDSLCERSKEDEARCRAPVDLGDGSRGLQNFGYERDLTHFTIEGSRFMTDTFAQMLTKDLYSTIEKTEVLPFP